jgi:hypothetical protein
MICIISGCFLVDTVDIRAFLCNIHRYFLLLLRHLSLLLINNSLHWSFRSNVHLVDRQQRPWLVNVPNLLLVDYWYSDPFDELFSHPPEPATRCPLLNANYSFLRLPAYSNTSIWVKYSWFYSKLPIFHSSTSKRQKRSHQQRRPSMCDYQNRPCCTYSKNSTHLSYHHLSAKDLHGQNFNRSFINLSHLLVLSNSNCMNALDNFVNLVFVSMMNKSLPIATVKTLPSVVIMAHPLEPSLPLSLPWLMPIVS